ncbi:MAG: penicillin acylase family protein [Saprospiraceae bacterium]|nr:penicillin acylase family protein [Saprospiraceae bacterium]
MYGEKIITKKKKLFYEYAGKLKRVKEKVVSLNYLSNNVLKRKSITTYATHHGPIMAKRDGKWVSLKSHNRSMNSLIQSWKRTKAKGFEDYKTLMDLKENTSNSTVFADNKGNIAFWHGNFVPIRDKKLNWSQLIDGSIASTEWQLAGGENNNPDSKHFNDQLTMYTKGKFKEVLFYKEDIEKNAERTYQPGE